MAIVLPSGLGIWYIQIYYVLPWFWLDTVDEPIIITPKWTRPVPSDVNPLVAALYEYNELNADMQWLVKTLTPSDSGGLLQYC